MITSLQQGNIPEQLKRFRQEMFGTAQFNIIQTVQTHMGVQTDNDKIYFTKNKCTTNIFFNKNAQTKMYSDTRYNF